MLPLPSGQIRSVWELFLYKGAVIMSSSPIHLDFDLQVNLLQKREMIINNPQKAAQKLEQIGYYKIKEAAYPLSKIGLIDEKKTRIYPDVTFDDVLTRYYQDKNLRIYILHSIEEIEVSIKARISFILGKGSYGAFGYLKFGNWCNKSEYCKHYLLYKQNSFQANLRKKVGRSNNHELANQLNLNNGLPSVWLMVDLLTFGDIVDLINLMSKRNLSELASYYNCDITSFVSWIKCLHLVRNICAHNGNIVDIKLKTTPIVHDSWENILFKFPDGRHSNRLAIVICILQHFQSSIDSNYNFDRINSSFSAIISDDDKRANLIGFNNKDSHKLLLPKKKRFTSRKSDHKNKKNHSPQK